MAKSAKKPACAVCHKSNRTSECSHVDCPNRKPITAGGDIYGVRDGEGGLALNPSAWVKRPTEDWEE
jgi:hypothetical protein